MRKTELTKEQQVKFKWLMKADTKNEDVKVSKFGYLIWEDGTWESGFWEGGIWKGGVWKDGYMWSNLKQKYIYVKWSSHKKEFEEDLK